MLILGDFAPGVVKNNPLEPVTGYNVFAFPSIEGSAPAVVGGGDLCVNFKTSEAATAFLEYLTTPEAAEIWVARGGFTSPNKNVDESAYADEITRANATGLTKAEEFRFDMSDLQPAALGGTSGQGLWKGFTDFVANPDNIDADHAADGGRRDEGVRASRAAHERVGNNGGSPLPGASARGRERGFFQRYGVTLVFLAPTLVLLTVWIVYPTIRTIQRSFYDRSGDDFIGIDNYRTLFTDDTLLTAIKNNFLWLLIVPFFVTAIGLLFAVLLERIRFSVAFKVVVFMPMAISLFAAGVIWRLMYEKDPSRGRSTRRSRS